MTLENLAAWKISETEKFSYVKKINNFNAYDELAWLSLGTCS